MALISLLEQNKFNSFLCHILFTSCVFWHLIAVAKKRKIKAGTKTKQSKADTKTVLASEQNEAKHMMERKSKQHINRTMVSVL